MVAFGCCIINQKDHVKSVGKIQCALIVPAIKGGDDIGKK